MSGSPRQDALRDAYTAYQDHDYKTAFQKFKKLAERGDPNAQDGLATMYSNGLGVPESEIESMSWYRRGAMQGFPHAQFMLATYCATGRGIGSVRAHPVTGAVPGKRLRPTASRS